MSVFEPTCGSEGNEKAAGRIPVEVESTFDGSTEPRDILRALLASVSGVAVSLRGLLVPQSLALGSLSPTTLEPSFAVLEFSRLGGKVILEVLASAGGKCRVFGDG